MNAPRDWKKCPECGLTQGAHADMCPAMYGARIEAEAEYFARAAGESPLDRAVKAVQDAGAAQIGSGAWQIHYEPRGPVSVSIDASGPMQAFGSGGGGGGGGGGGRSGAWPSGGSGISREPDNAISRQQDSELSRQHDSEISPEVLLKRIAAENRAEHEVTNPSHYRAHPSGVECITITEHMSFNLGNAVKYIWRADLKHETPLDDLKKARWYLDREIARRGGRS
ncbi:DUF3310 domain-containing protein [Paraburkholderia sp. RL18-103-BIB-C]|uniref:DUF3310 domain-containing protein n=1 Tax=Paraburkholderia sp. RL18-103-BIB-C TaxID=3031637 RepID=UPI0038BA08FC